jgi:hypothetical protein
VHAGGYDSRRVDGPRADTFGISLIFGHGRFL